MTLDQKLQKLQEVQAIQRQMLEAANKNPNCPDPIKSNLTKWGEAVEALLLMATRPPM